MIFTRRVRGASPTWKNDDLTMTRFFNDFENFYKLKIFVKWNIKVIKVYSFFINIRCEVSFEFEQSGKRKKSDFNFSKVLFIWNTLMRYFEHLMMRI